MKKYIIFILLCTTIATSLTAQNQKRDTTVLAVYNNNQRFMLYPMPFGKDRPDNDFVAEMVFSLDTVNLLKDMTVRDSSGKFPKRWQPERRCDKKPSNVKGKVALLTINASCDVSTQVYNAQEAGALAVIVIHTTNNRDTVILPKRTGQEKYANDNKVKIPCFTVRQEIGATLIQLSPSLVGIIRPKTDIPNTQSLVTTNNPLLPPAQNSQQKPSVDSTGKAMMNETSDNAFSLSLDNLFDSKEWAMSPNPATNEAILNYNFTKSSILIVEVFNELGQVIKNFTVPNTQTGKLVMDVSKWQSGAYNVRIITNDKREVKRFVVTH